MNREELVTRIARTSNESKLDVERHLNHLISAIQSAIVEDEPVKIAGFGTFKRITRKQRTGINPKTLESIVIPEHDAVVFVVSDKIKTLIN